MATELWGRAYGGRIVEVDPINPSLVTDQGSRVEWCSVGLIAVITRC